VHVFSRSPLEPMGFRVFWTKNSHRFTDGAELWPSYRGTYAHPVDVFEFTRFPVLQVRFLLAHPVYMSDNCDACRERAIRRLLWYCSRVVWRRRSYSGHQTRLSEDLNEPGCQLRLVWGTRHAAVMYHTVQGRIQEFCMKVRRWIPLLWRWNRFCLCTTKTEANLFHTVKNSSIYFSKFVPFLLILGKWQTSHEGTSIVGRTETKKTQKRDPIETYMIVTNKERLRLKTFFRLSQPR